MVRGEDRTERGRDDVEGAVLERERLGVRLHPVQLHAPRAGLAPARFEVLWREVGRHNVRTRLGGADRDVPRARGDVEHALAGCDPARVHEHRPENPDGLGREPVVVAERPQGPLLGLVRHFLDPGGCRGLHGWAVSLHAGTVGSGRRGGFARSGHLRAAGVGRFWLGGRAVEQA